MSTAKPVFYTAKPENAEAIRILVRAAYSKWIPVIGREPLPMRVDYVKAAQEHQIEMLFTGSELVGIVEMHDRSDHLWIENIAVAPLRHGMGFGRLLLAHSERAATERGYGELQLLTNAEFRSNVAWYEKTGFTIIKTESFLDGTTVYMRKALIA